MNSLIAIALGVALSTGAQVPQGNQVVATVDNVPIIAADIDKALWDWFSEDVVEEFIANTLVANAIKREGIVLDQKDVDGFLARLLAEAKLSMDENADVEAELKKQGMPRSRLAARAATEMGLRKLTEARFKPAEQRKIAWIMIRPAGPSVEQKAAAKMNADEAHKQLETMDWSAVARARSDDANSAVRGGEIGWFAVDEMPPDVSAAISDLAEGGHTGVIDSQGLFAIYRVVTIGAPESDVDGLRATFVARNLDKVFREIRTKAKIERKTN